MDHVKVEVQVELLNSLQQIGRHLNHSLLNTLRVFLCKLNFLQHREPFLQGIDSDHISVKSSPSAQTIGRADQHFHGKSKYSS